MSLEELHSIFSVFALPIFDLSSNILRRTSRMADWTECMNYGIHIAREAREVILHAFRIKKAVMLKSSPADLVTETDQRVERMLISAIKAKYPHHKFIGEESVAAGEKLILTDSPTWIIDPIDGTANFVHRFPFVAISIAFAVNKQTEFGIVYSCIEDKLYSAQRGRGAFCNDIPLATSGQEDITKCLLVTEIGSERDQLALATMTSNIHRLLEIPVHGIRAVGTAAVDMCLISTGGADAYYHIGMHCWDIAASALIVSEAGGVVIDTNGSEFDMMARRVIAASSMSVARRIAQAIQAFPCERDDDPRAHPQKAQIEHSTDSGNDVHKKAGGHRRL
ncbi:inositol monophosphatase 1-like [Anguilla rostrata]|uniref:inositol monophosphatase 1-like n=1 Tax=Anguilla rostrata TaxID=7938 RepID=UPI0030CF99F0